MSVFPFPFHDRALMVFLEEDIGRGDITTLSLFTPSELDQPSKAILISESEGILCGAPFVERILAILDPSFTIHWETPEGGVYKTGHTLATIESRLGDLLAGERLVLNLLKHLSGIATMSRTFVERANHSRPAGMRSLRIVETRKTLPGLRAFQKYAVRIGGGHNHRFSLDDGILIKDNHLVAIGGIKKALERVRSNAPHPLRIELEVDTADQAIEGATHGADVLLLDNMSLETLGEVIPRLRSLRPELLLEVSGGVTLNRIDDLARLDIDIISVGALTHSSPDAPIRLDFLK
ncbi:MAG: carboxylating nicotinate-nucleotide diphosphorylase [Leptospirales bacterium]